MEPPLDPAGDQPIPRLSFDHSTGRSSRVDVVRLRDLRRRQLDHSIYSPTRLDFHLLHFVTHGDGVHHVDFERIALTAGDVLAIRPAQAHAFDAASTHDAKLLMFTPEALQVAHIPQPTRWHPGVVLRPPADDFHLLVELLKLQETLDTRASSMRAESVAPYLLGTVLAGLADVVAAGLREVDLTARRYEALVLEFETLLDHHHGAQRSPAWYAATLGTTPRTLTRACQRVRESSPKRLIDLRVILEAKRRLATSTDTVEATGYRLGFSEPTNFVKFFKRLVGATPDAFRRSHGAT